MYALLNPASLLITWEYAMNPWSIGFMGFSKVNARLNCPTFTLANPYFCHSTKASTIRGPLDVPGVPLSCACIRYVKSLVTLPSTVMRTKRVLKLSLGVLSSCDEYWYSPIT